MNTRNMMAMAVISALAANPAHADFARDMSVDDAARLHSRWQRSLWSSSDKTSYPPAALDAMARKRRRARQTHPGKRGRA